MKTISKTLIFILISIMSTSLAYAGNDEGKNKEESSTYKEVFLKEIRKSVDYPKFALEREIQGYVLVRFVIAENGGLNIVETNSTNDYLLEHVLYRLSDIYVCSHASSKEYNMRFSFVMQ